MTAALETRESLTAAQINDLPDSAFAYIEPGGSKDEDGRTVPRSKRHFPVHDAAHVRNALSRAPQSPFGDKAMPKILKAARKFGIRSASVEQAEHRELGVCLRDYDFEIRSAGRGGRTMEGYAAVFGRKARIADVRGDFDESIRSGAFKRTLDSRTPVLQFDHGKDPRVGTVPIGAFEEIREDSTGLYVRATLFDNAAVEPVRQAIQAQAIRGMSFRFTVPKGGDTWTRDAAGVEQREVHDADVFELGPVVFPAYDGTSVNVRTLLAGLDPAEVRALARELRDLLADPQTITGRPTARSRGGGDLDVEPWEGKTPPAPTAEQAARDRAWQARRPALIIPPTFDLGERRV